LCVGWREAEELGDFLSLHQKNVLNIL